MSDSFIILSNLSLLIFSLLEFFSTYVSLFLESNNLQYFCSSHSLLRIRISVDMYIEQSLLGLTKFTVFQTFLRKSPCKLRLIVVRSRPYTNTMYGFGSLSNSSETTKIEVHASNFSSINVRYFPLHLLFTAMLRHGSIPDGKKYFDYSSTNRTINI